MSFEDDIDREIGRIPKHRVEVKRAVDISKHPLLRAVYDLMQMIEMFPASDHETATIIKAGEVLDGVDALRAEVAALKKNLRIAQFDNGIAIPELEEMVDRLKKERDLFKERWELEQIRYDGISSANEELQKENRVLRKVAEAASILMEHAMPKGCPCSACEMLRAVLSAAGKEADRGPDKG